MISKLLDIKDHKQQSLYLSQLVQKSSKNCKQFIDQITEQLILKLIQIVYVQNFTLWLEFTLTLLSIQELFQYANQGRSTTTPMLKLFDFLGTLKVDNMYENVSRLVVKYQNVQNSVGLHAFIAKNCVSNTKQSQLPSLLPTFIRLSSYIIQKYLQLKNEPSKGQQDRIEDDKVILKCCQKWVSDNISLFFSQLPSVKDQATKQLVLLAVGDIIGGLLQTNRENILDKQLTSSLLQNTLLGYVRKHYTLSQIKSHFLSSLRLKNFNNPIKKVEIPGEYTDFHLRNIGLNAQAYSYMTIQIIKSGLLSVCDNDYLLQYLVPAVSELLMRPYQIKIRGIFLLQKILQSAKQVKIRNGFQYGYPIQLLLFFVFQYENEKYESIRKHFVFQSQQSLASSLLIFHSLPLQGLQNQKVKFQTDVIINHKLLNSSKLLVILRRTNFNEQKTERQLILLQIIDKLRVKNERQCGEVIKIWKSKSEGLDSAVLEKLM